MLYIPEHKDYRVDSQSPTSPNSHLWCSLTGDRPSQAQLSASVEGLPGPRADRVFTSNRVKAVSARPVQLHPDRAKDSTAIVKPFVQDRNQRPRQFAT
jgi:hypothetical protein